MDPIVLAKLAIESGPWVSLIACLLYALRWSIKRGDAAQAAQIANGEKTSVALDASTKALIANTELLNDFMQAQAVEHARQAARAEIVDQRRSRSGS